MSSDSQEFNVVPDSVYIKRNFNQLVRFKLRYYEKEVRDILEGRFFKKIIEFSFWEMTLKFVF
jgi:hypothetical protein